MKTVDVFYQAEGIREIGHIEVADGQPISSVKAAIAEKHGLDSETLVFLEDGEEPLNEEQLVRVHADPRGFKAHVHRCRHIEVSVRFNGELVERRFAPGVTVGRVKRWAADEIGMDRDEAGEHVLQLSGTTDRPTPGTHIGTLAGCTQCRIDFDLVPDERVNGCPGEESEE